MGSRWELSWLHLGCSCSRLMKFPGTLRTTSPSFHPANSNCGPATRIWMPSSAHFGIPYRNAIRMSSFIFRFSGAVLAWMQPLKLLRDILSCLILWQQNPIYHVSPAAGSNSTRFSVNTQLKNCRHRVMQSP